MNIRVTRRKVIKILESDKPTLEKYKRIRKYFVPLTGKKVEKQIKFVIPILKKIYSDPEARTLVENLDFEKTSDFLTFLETSKK